ncbi:MAG: DPP IV N-terminal domain-containing protein, partial [Tannerella sp.]|nr:DPP IV N-terminal domain-containing protein [Tannerella sp.]
MKKVLFFILIGGLLQAVFAQETLPEYEQARRWAPHNAEHLLFSYVLRPNYFNNSPKFWYEYKTSEGVKWYVVDPEQGRKQPLFDLDELASQISEITKSPFTAQQLPIRGLKLEDDDKTFSFSVPKESTTIKPNVKAPMMNFKYDFITRKLTVADKPDAFPPRWGSVSPSKNYVIYAKDLNLWCMTYADYEKVLKNPNDKTVNEIQLTTDGVEDFGYGMPQFRLSTDTLLDHKRKFVYGSWSPDGRYFATQLDDERPLNFLWVIHSTAKPRPVLESYRYQMPGEPGAPNVHLYLFDMQDHSRKEINVEKYKNQTLRIAFKPREKMTDPTTWLGDDKKFYLTRYSRDLKKVDVCTYTVGDDSLKTVINEELNTYIETRPLAVTDDGKELIHWSERDGWAHLYL